MPVKKPARRKDGRYAVKYKGKTFYAYSPDEALQARKDYIKAEESGRLLKREMTVKEYALKWLPLHKANVSEKCYNDYAKQLEALFPYIGHMLLSQVTVDDAASVWKHYAGYSDSTIHRAHMLYVGLFDTAIENELCHKNPFNSKWSQPPEGTSGSHRALTEEEITTIVSTPHRFQLAVLVMLYAGLRRGEVLALSSDNIDLKHDIIHVHEAVRYDSNQPILTDPKTDAGIRSVPIFSVLRPYLLNHSGLIATSANGTIMSETSFKNAWSNWKNHIELKLNNCKQKRWYFLEPSYRHRDPERYDRIQQLMKRGKKEEADELRFSDWKEWTVRSHDLRHTFCTMLRDAGVDIKQAMIWMGHADEKMILEIYDHVEGYRLRTSINKVESMLAERKPDINVVRIG